MAQISLTFPDGNQRDFAAGATAAEVAASISPSLAKRAISATLDGAHYDLQWPITKSARIAIHTMKDEAQALELIRHDLAHIMARAVQELWPDVKVTIGPVIENGWYYDFDRAEPFSPEDLGRHRGEDEADHQRPRSGATELWSRSDAIAYSTRRRTSPSRSNWSRRSPATSRSACTGTGHGKTCAEARICSIPARCPPMPSS